MLYVPEASTRPDHSLRQFVLVLALGAVACGAHPGGNDEQARNLPGSAGASASNASSASSATALDTAGAPSDGSNPAGFATSGQAGAAAVHDHCVYGYDPQPSDATMNEGPAEYYPAGKTDPSLVDLIVQPAVLSWMQDHFWEAAHAEWHAIRTCSIPGGARGSIVNICQFTDMIPTDQNCQSAGDGYQFLLFHRHMLEALKQLWPKHSEQFSGFPRLPKSADDIPAQWRSAWKNLNASDLANAKVAEEIAQPQNLAMFPDEGALGFWLQCNVGTSLAGFGLKASGLHGDLHAHWVRPENTDHGLGNTRSNVDNYLFWKLHGWMDDVWEKYRTAKGLKRTDPKYVSDMRAQCREMDILAEICKTGRQPVEQSPPLPVEAGFFHEKVRPIFDSAANKCSGCHSAAGPEATLALGGHISSKDIVFGLVDRASIGGGQFKRVVPGQPDQSWLYLKMTAATRSCTKTDESQCFPGPMPPSADGLATVSAADAAIVRQWIADGAKGPE